MLNNGCQFTPSLIIRFRHDCATTYSTSLYPSSWTLVFNWHRLCVTPYCRNYWIRQITLAFINSTTKVQLGNVLIFFSSYGLYQVWMGRNMGWVKGTNCWVFIYGANCEWLGNHKCEYKVFLLRWKWQSAGGYCLVGAKGKDRLSWFV